MKLVRCPTCKSHIYIEGILQDDASKELLRKVTKMAPRLALPLISYIGLFRPDKQDLSNARALRLIDEVLALSPSQDVLIEAMTQTTSQILAKRQHDAGHKPLKNHNYLKQVLSSTATALPASTSKVDSTSTVEIKEQGLRQSDAEAQAAWERQMAGYQK